MTDWIECKSDDRDAFFNLKTVRLVERQSDGTLRVWLGGHGVSGREVVVTGEIATRLFEYLQGKRPAPRETAAERYLGECNERGELLGVDAS